VPGFMLKTMFGEMAECNAGEQRVAAEGRRSSGVYVSLSQAGGGVGNIVVVHSGGRRPVPANRVAHASAC